MIRSAAILGISVDRLWCGWVLLVILCLAPGCDPTDTGNENQNGNTNGNSNGNTNGNENGNPTNPQPGQIFVQFNLDPTTTDLARALEGDETQYGFFGAKNADGSPAGLSQVDTILPTLIAVRATIDDSERPSQLLGADDSALLLSYNATGTEVTAIFVAPNGETSSMTATLSAISARSAQQAASDLSGVCDRLDGFSAILEAIFGSCTDQLQTALCNGSIAQAVSALDVFCDMDLIIVTEGLADSVGRGPALGIPLGVVVDVEAESVSPNTGVTLRGSVFGGMPPYLFSWAFLDDSAAQPTITATSTGTISTASFNPVTEGVYSLRLNIFDFVGESAFFDASVVVVENPGALRVEAVAEQSGDDALTVTLVANATGGAPPYGFTWSVVDGPGTVSFDDITRDRTDATFSRGGNYILEVAVEDALADAATFSLPVSIFDVQTSLAAQMTFPPCARPTAQDTCVGQDGGSIVLGVIVDNESSSAALVYEWEIVDGATSAGLSSSNQASTTLTTLPSGLDTVRVRVTVTDQATSEVAFDERTVEIIQEAVLAAILLTDGEALLNQPEPLLAVVTGVVGELTYQWSVEPAGSGSFDSTSAQNVQFTPTERPAAGQTLEVRVTVTDSAANQTVNATADLSVTTFPVSINGDDVILRNDLAAFSAVLSSSAPPSVTYKWTVAKEDSQDSLSITLLSDTQSSTQIVADGDGVFYLTLRVTDTSDADNVSTAVLPVRVVCADSDITGTVDAGAAQLAATGAGVMLTCSSNPGGATLRWRSLNDVIADFPDNAASVTFTMPGSAPLNFAPLEFECRSFLGNSPPQCEPSDTTLVFAQPIVSPTVDSQNKTVAPNVFVTLRCEQTSGSTADAIGWRQVGANGAVVSPPTVPGFDEDPATGILTFSAPSTPQVLFFECRGVIVGPEGELAGPYNTTTRARVTVQTPP